MDDAGEVYCCDETRFFSQKTTRQGGPNISDADNNVLANALRRVAETRDSQPEKVIAAFQNYA